MSSHHLTRFVATAFLAIALASSILLAPPAQAATLPIRWQVVDASVPSTERPPIIAGQRSLWCGEYNSSWVKVVGYPNCEYQILYLDTGSHAADYSLTLTMNCSTERDYDYLYLIGGGGSSVDPIGNDASIFDQAARTGSSGAARRLVAWTGSIRNDVPGAGSIDTRSFPVTIAGTDMHADYWRLSPEDVRTTIQISAAHRALYFVFESDLLFSPEDGLWPLGNGVVFDDVQVSDGGVLFDEQLPSGVVDAYGGNVLVGTSATPLVSGRTADRPLTLAVTPASPVTVGEGGTLTLVVVASDADCFDVVTSFTSDLSALPAGSDAAFTLTPVPNPSPYRTGRLVWHPAAGDAGSYPVTFTAVGNTTATTTVIINVLRVGTVAGTVLGLPCGGSTTPVPLRGVTVDAFAVGNGFLAGTAVTDASGAYSIPLLAEGNYTISLVTPLGYDNAGAEQYATVTASQTTTTNLTLTCVPADGRPMSAGFWKHQVGVARGGNGNAEIDAATLCDELDLVRQHFNDNALNQVVVYNPPQFTTCAGKLYYAEQVLNLGGSPAPIDKAKQQLLALLLNVAANYIGLTDVISKDGATVSQAITYCDGIIDNPSADRTLASSIAEKINSGQKVNAGVIPLGTAQISYRRSLALRTFRVTPNPGPGARLFEFTMGERGTVRLRLFDVRGRLVRSLSNSALEEGEHRVRWDGTNDGQVPVGNGIYFARLDTPGGSKTLKVIRLDR